MATVDITTATATIGGVTATATLGSKTVTIASAVATLFGAGLRAVATASDFPTAALYDVDNTWLAALPDVEGLQWQRQPNVPGSLSMRLPMDNAATADATAKRFLKIFWRGRCVQAARIDGSSIEVEADGRTWREFNQLPGVTNLTADMSVCPEYGVGRSGQTQRTFGWMSKPGTWRSSGNWTTAQATKWSELTGVRAGKPEGLDFPDPSWLTKNGVHFYEAVGQLQFFYRDFTTTSSIDWQILATADNWLTLALDGETIITPDAQDGQTWRFLVQLTGTIPPGKHTLAAKVLNGGHVAPQPMGLLCTMQQMLGTGEVVDGPPFINSDASWKCSDIVPGFKRGDTLSILFLEAAARGVQPATIMSLGFTYATDSDGIAWPDTPSDYSFDVGSSVLDAIQQLTEADMDVDVDPDSLTINAYHRLGADLFSTVKLDLAENGGGIDSHRIDRVEAKFNTAVVQLADGTFIEVQDAASVAEFGRLETGLSLGTVADKATAQRLAQAQFKESAWPSYTFTTTLSPVDGKQIYRDFNVGDSIGVPNETGDGYVKVRVMSITVDASSEVPVITPELALDPS